MATVKLVNETGYSQQIQARSHRMTADEPLSNGGGDSGPAPYELLLASLAACTSLTLRMYAARKAWPLGAIAVDAVFARAEDGAENIVRIVRVAGELDDAQCQRLADICERTPVTKTLKRALAIQTRLELVNA